MQKSGCPQVEGARQAASTSAFFDTLGFNVAVSELENKRADGLTPLAHLQALGVKHLRGNASVPLGLSGALATTLLNAGMRYTFALSLKTDLDAFLPMTLGVTEAVQVASPANDWIGPYSVTELPAAAERWRAQLNALDSAKRPALIGPIIFQTMDAMDLGSVGPWIDFGGFRYTIGLVAPSRSFGGDWEQMALSVSGGKPLVASKASYATSRPGLPEPQLSEDLQAKYVVRLFLEGFNHAVIRTHYDKLYDDDCSESGCTSGLIRVDGTSKPSYLAWAALVKALGAPSQPPTPRALPLTIEAPTNVHSLLLSNSEGAFFLLLWLEVNGKPGEDQQAPAVVQVGVPLASAQMLDLRQPGQAPSDLGKMGRFSLAVSDAPMLITLTPACF
ncbi:MAG: hypothetical protein SF187_00935 [Deltaproteobacteria bacterium]|nr:hypothetical protein [Deltaproteobacteria bacterium]